MDTRTGEIYGDDEKQRLLKALGKDFGEAVAARELMPIDRRPPSDCRACAGKGFLGYYDNSKVIPCVCVFSEIESWYKACEEQRNAPKATADKYSKRLRGIG